MLLDLNLPRVNGIEVLRRIRGDERTRRQPVVVLTSSDERSERGECYDLGVNAFLRKPVEVEKFFDIVKILGLFWLILNEMPPEGG